jgi:hypothetical protein
MFYLKKVLNFKCPAVPLIHLHEPSEEEYGVAVRGYSCVKFEVFIAVLLKIQCI